jgi:RNA polymerase sigma-70 factor (ECF subfamily)
MPHFVDVVAHEWEYVVLVAQRTGVPERQCEDIAIEVFIRLERNFATITSPFSMRAWLRTATVHVAHEYLRLRNLQRETLNDLNVVERGGYARSPEEVLSGVQTYGALLACVDALEPKRRAVFRAYAMEELQMSEVAARLRIRETTAYNRLRLAREDLQDALHRLWKADERKPGGKSFGVLPLLLALNAHLEQRSATVLCRAVSAITYSLRAAALAGAAMMSVGAILQPARPGVVMQSEARGGKSAAPPATLPVQPAIAARLLLPPPPTKPEAETGKRPRESVAVPVPAAPRKSVSPAHSDRLASSRSLLTMLQSALQRGDLGEAASALARYRVEYPDDPLAQLHRSLSLELALRCTEAAARGIQCH